MQEIPQNLFVNSNKVSQPFVDLHAQYLSIKEEIDSAISRVIRESSFIRGPHVEAFELNFSEKLKIKSPPEESVQRQFPNKFNQNSALFVIKSATTSTFYPKAISEELQW